MSTEASQPLKISLVCSTDLAALSSTAQYTFVKIAQTASATHFNIGEAVPALTADTSVIGVLQNKPTAQGQMCEVVVCGVTKLKSGDAILPGAPVAILTSGSIGLAGSATVTGSTYTKSVVGRALGTSAWASGDVMTAVVSCLAVNAAT